MQQYEDLYKDFKFLGVFPIDFQQHYPSGGCIGERMCDFQVKAYDGRRIGMVLNLDRHDQSGSHWVAVYADFRPSSPNFGIFYYDSVAIPPGAEVTAFMKSVTEQVDRHFPRAIAKRFRSLHNTVQRQFKNTECGMFSMVCLTQLLKGVPFEEVIRKMKKDDDIFKIRNILYRPM